MKGAGHRVILDTKDVDRTDFDSMDVGTKDIDSKDVGRQILIERKGLIDYDHIPSINSKPLENQVLNLWG